MKALEKQWHSKDTGFGRTILAGDIGGTHTNLALFGEEEKRLELLYKCVFPTQEIDDFGTPLSEMFDDIRATAPSLQPQSACISVAGPAHDNYCKLTNAGWAVDGKAISERFGVETRVINDFLALSYSVPLLNLENRDQVFPLAHTDGSKPQPTGEVMAIVGAGTGLGTGFLVRHGDEYLAYPTEGGHSDFSAHDEETARLEEFIARHYPFAPGTEPFIAGRGIASIFEFRKSLGMQLTGSLAEIDALPDAEKPARISQAVDSSPECREIMRLHTSMYARYAARAALMYLPTGGLFVAGGIAAKNLPLFTENDHFMRVFESSYKDNIHEVLMRIPVYVVLDYAISLYGAANAARVLIPRS